jgi:dUTP pyrophosphatase
MIQQISVKIKRLHPNAKIPAYGSDGAAGCDLYSIEEHVFLPGETYAIKTGIAMEVPEGKAFFIWDRSGMGLKGLHRFAGLIDSDYRGEIKIILFNSTQNNFKISKFDKIAQGVFQDYYQAEFNEVSELSETQRGIGGFGSTGR